MAEVGTGLFLGDNKIQLIQNNNFVFANPFYAEDPSPLPAIDETNILRWYDAEYNANGTTWTDNTGTQDATVQGNVTYDNTASPFYYDFIGGTGTNGIGHSATSDMSVSGMTIQMWVKHSTSSNVQYCVASQRSGTGTSNVRYSLHLNPQNNTVGIYNGQNFSTVSGATQNSGTWYFFEMLMTTSQTTVYQNDVLRGTISRGLTTGAGNQPFGIGTPNYNLSTFSGEFFKGDIAMCLVYDSSSRPTGNWDATKARFGY